MLMTITKEHFDLLAEAVELAAENVSGLKSKERATVGALAMFFTVAQELGARKVSLVIEDEIHTILSTKGRG